MKPILMLTCFLFAATNLQAAPAGPPNSVENLSMSLKATKKLVGTWKAPYGLIELKADGVIRNVTHNLAARWKVDSNPHATNLITYRYDFKTGQETVLHNYKLRGLTENSFSLSEGEKMEVWTRQ